MLRHIALDVKKYAPCRSKTFVPLWPFSSRFCSLFLKGLKGGLVGLWAAAWFAVKVQAQHIHSLLQSIMRHALVHDADRLENGIQLQLLHHVWCATPVLVVRPRSVCHCTQLIRLCCTHQIEIYNVFKALFARMQNKRKLDPSDDGDSRKRQRRELVKQVRTAQAFDACMTTLSMTLECAILELDSVASVTGVTSARRMCHSMLKLVQTATHEIKTHVMLPIRSTVETAMHEHLVQQVLFALKQNVTKDSVTPVMVAKNQLSTAWNSALALTQHCHDKDEWCRRFFKLQDVTDDASLTGASRITHQGVTELYDHGIQVTHGQWDPCRGVQVRDTMWTIDHLDVTLFEPSQSCACPVWIFS